MYGITVSDSYVKLVCLLSTSVHSALIGGIAPYVLYKSTYSLCFVP